MNKFEQKIWTTAMMEAGFSGLSAAAYLSFAGYEARVYEKNATAGGRARQLKTENGYVFDMGPGVQPSLISKKIAAEQFLKQLNRIMHEIVV